MSETMPLKAQTLKAKETESQEIEGTILAANIIKLYVCVNSNGRIAADDDSDTEMVKCTSCGQMILESLLSATLSANFLLGDLQGEKIFTKCPLSTEGHLLPPSGCFLTLTSSLDIVQVRYPFVTQWLDLTSSNCDTEFCSL